MWFLSARNARRTPSASPKRGAFRPRLETLEDRCLLSAGALDTSFGSGGVVTGPITHANANAVVVQSDGKIVAGGDVTTAKGLHEFALVRYNADGSLDNSFGKSGVVETAVGVNDSYMNGLALQSNGDIVAVGQAVNYVQIRKVIHYDPAFAVARYLPTGVLDTSFGSGGIVLTNVESDQVYSGTVGAFAVVIEPPSGPYANDIYVAGTANPSSTVNTGDVFALARYTTNGTLDKNFGGTGMVVTSQFAGQPDQATALTMDGNNIVVAGTTGTPIGLPANWAMAVVRYTSLGVPDSSFGTNGIVQGLAPGYISPTDDPHPTRAHAVLVQSGTGDIVVGGHYFGTPPTTMPTSNENQILVRLTPLGNVDGGFGGVGNLNSPYVINTQLYGTLAIAQEANGDLLATSATLLASSTPNEIGVAAYLPNGAPDMTFGNNGTTTVPVGDFPGGVSYGIAMAIQADGKIVVAGSGTPTGIALARFLAPDTSTIGSFIGSSTGVGSGTLMASSITNSDSSAIILVNFYVQNSDLTLTLVGTGTYTSGASTINFSGVSSGTHTFVAQAVDSNGDLSDPLAISLTVL